MNIKTDRLRKSSTDSMLLGVAGGMAEYFEIDPTLMRIAWVLLIIVSAGMALIAYLVLAIIMPNQASKPVPEMTPDVGEEDYEAPPPGRRWSRRHGLFGGVLIVAGVLLLLSNLGALNWWRWDIFWPVVIIAVGVAIIASRLTARDDG